MRGKIVKKFPQKPVRSWLVLMHGSRLVAACLQQHSDGLYRLEEMELWKEYFEIFPQSRQANCVGQEVGGEAFDAEKIKSK